MSLFDGPAKKKYTVLFNHYRSSVCLTAAVIFARLRWWGNPWLATRQGYKGATEPFSIYGEFAEIPV